MNRSACVFILLVFLNGVTFGQPSDSLLSEYNSQTGIKQIETGLLLCKELEDNPEKMLEISFSLLEKSHKIKTETLLTAKILKNISEAYVLNDSIEKAIEYFDKTLKVAEPTQNNTAFLAEVYDDLGINYNEIGETQKALDYLTKSVEMYKPLNEPDGIADAMSDLGTVYYSMGQLDKAIELFTKVYEIDCSTGNIRNQSSSLNNLGRMYIDWGKYETGIEFYKRSLALLDSVADRKIFGLRYNNIGMAYQKMGQHPEAISWFQKALQFDSEENNKLKIGIRQFNLATSYLALNDLVNAKYYLEQAEIFFTNLDLPSSLTKVYGELGALYQKQGNSKTAESYFLKAKDMAERAGTKPEKAIADNYLYQYYKFAGQPAKALNYFEEYTANNDSIYKLEVAKQIEELEKIYQTEKKESEIQRLETENELRLKEITFRKRERNWAFAGITLLVGFLAGLFFLYTTVKKQKQILAQQNIRLDELNHMQYKLFRIISHDLRNGAAAFQTSSKIIQYHLKNGQPDKLIPLSDEIGKSARNLTSMLENLLEWAGLQMKGLKPDSKTISIKEAFQFQAESMREVLEKKSNQLEIYCDSETIWCDPESFNIILRNLLNNAIKFTSNGRITLRSNSVNENTVLEISDTGCGMSEEMVSHIFDFKYAKTRTGTAGEKGTGLGLQLVQEHVLKNNASIELKSQINKGTTFTITFPNIPK